MKSKQIILLTFCLAGFAVTGLKAQQDHSAAGGEASGPGGTVSYTIGQANYITANGPGGSISQGVQQPIEIFILSGVEGADIQLKCAVYPNPAAEFVMLDIESPVTEQMSYILYDTQGKIHSYMKIANSETRISLSGLSNSTYYIRVLDDNNEVKTFKIIKNR